MGEVRVVVGELRHVPAIADLLASLMEHHGEMPLPPERLAEAVRRVMCTHDSEYLVAELDDDVVGTVQVNYRYSTWNAAPYAFLEDFVVMGSHRRRGVGTRLLQHAVSRARERGSCRVDLDIHCDNEKALRFYQRHGFAASGYRILRMPLGGRS